MELWRELLEAATVVLIPAARDASSDRFRRTVVRAVREQLRERAIHAARGGAPSAARRVSKALDELGKLTETLTVPLWKGIAPNLPAGMATTGGFSFDASASDLIEWLAEHTRLRLATGDHDVNQVSPVELGSGLQSLLDLAILMPESDDRQMILAVEEPEAFLHPSAQRTLARTLLQEMPGVQKLVSTHSPVIVDEAKYGAVVLVRNHEVFEPRPQEGARRDQINTALLSGQGSEAIFSEAVLLVEGEGDRLFFEALRRRLVRLDQTGCLEKLSVVSVGSKTAFAPWIRLIESYRDGKNRPIDWLVVGDGADAITDIQRAFKDAEVTIAKAVLDEIARAGHAQGSSAQNDRITATQSLNRVATEHGARFHLLPIDLEWCALRDAGSKLLRYVADGCGSDYSSRKQVLRRLGSKYGQGPVAEPMKAPWLRAQIGARIGWHEVSEDVRGVLERWIDGAMADSEGARALIGRGAEWEVL